MTHEEKLILVRCLELIDELIEAEPEEWQTWLRRPWELEYFNGPKYAVGKWFGAQPERNRVRYRRAIAKLEEQGLVVTFRAWGTRLTNLDLTDRGIEVAEKLRQEAAEAVQDQET